MQAIILGGGKGTRLKPYTVVFPKPLMPIGDYPILEVVIRQLKNNGFEEIVLAVGHLKELIQSFFQDGSKWDVNISYSAEEKPLGTAAPLKQVGNCQEDFLVMNGDVLTNLNYREFFEFHNNNGALCTIATYHKPIKIDLGVLKVNDNNELYDYIEKPTIHYSVSMGVYAFKREALEYIPDDEYFDFPDLIKKLLKSNQKVLSYPFSGSWLDIGRPEDYELAADEFEKRKNEFLGDSI
jgi:NDP-sugar pyrophosphorylase family protein